MLKKLIINSVLLILAIVMVNNIKNQFITLREAKQQNQKMEIEILGYKEENKILGQEIEYAATDDFLEGEMRDKLGLGTSGDVWLILTDEENIDLYPKADEFDDVPIIEQWLRLFTQ